MAGVRIVHLVGNRDAPEVAHVLSALTDLVTEIVADQPTTAATVAAIDHAVRTDNATRVIVVGGDGMVHAAVNALAPHARAGRDVSLGVIPFGSGNDFARGLGIPDDDVATACAFAVGTARPVDLLETDYGWVASVATCGFSARVNAKANSMKRPTGSSKYTVATLALLPRLRADTMTVAVDGVAGEPTATTLVAVANTGWFGGGMHIAPEADPRDGSAVLVRVGRLGRMALLRYLPKVFDGRHVSHPATSFAPATTLELAGDGLELWGDGEPLGPLPVRITVVANALPVAAPA